MPELLAERFKPGKKPSRKRFRSVAGVLWLDAQRAAIFRKSDLRDMKNLECGQPEKANRWEVAYRDESRACGALIPTPPA